MKHQELKEIFSTKNGAVYQCEKRRCFYVKFGGYNTAFKFPCFLALKTRVFNIDLESMALNPDNSSDVEIISPCGSDRIYVLTLPQVLEFRELLAGAKVMLELNSILYERLYRITASI